MNKRALCLVAVIGLLVLGLSFALSEIRDLQEKVGGHDARIEQLEHR